MASDPRVLPGGLSVTQEELRRKRRKDRDLAREARWNQPMFAEELGPSLSGIQIEEEAPGPSPFKPLPSLGMGPVKDLQYDSPFKQDFFGLRGEIDALGSVGLVDPKNFDTGSMFGGVLPGGELSLPPLTGMVGKTGGLAPPLPEFNPGILGGVGTAAGIGAGLLGTALSAKKAAGSAALSMSPSEWHARRTDPSLHEIDRQALGTVDAARRGAEMEGGKAIAANIAGGSGWLGERAGRSLSDSFGRAATFAQQQANLRKAKVRDENEEERVRRVALRKAQPGQAGKALSGLVGLIPGPAGKIGQLITGLGSKAISSAIT